MSTGHGVAESRNRGVLGLPLGQSDSATPPPGDSATIPALRLADLAFCYPDGTAALRGADLVLPEGSCTALVGANGSGKTTLVGVLAGFHRPTAGSGELFGAPIDWRESRARREAIGFTFVDPDDQLFMPSLVEDVCFGPLCAGRPQAEVLAEAEALLAEFGLLALARRPPQHLSAGQKRLATLAACLALRPRLLVLDEPSAFLDPQARRQVIAHLARLPQTRLVVTHDLELALELCDRLAVLAEGRVVASGVPRALLADAALMTANRLEVPASLRA